MRTGNVKKIDSLSIGAETQESWIAHITEASNKQQHWPFRTKQIKFQAYRIYVLLLALLLVASLPPIRRVTSEKTQRK
ncbi:hypothetical protein [Nitrosomonas marina]|uniref:hypothetical protein n=1 Tax=Nitrosomonas marina TaxID=917 RepID=UPI000B828E2A|nr:hypothetical protein [Nitrosomonas marina]